MSRGFRSRSGQGVEHKFQEEKWDLRTCQPNMRSLKPVQDVLRSYGGCAVLQDRASGHDLGRAHSGRELRS